MDENNFNYEFVLRGYDCIVTPSDLGDEYFFVSLLEEGSPVFEIDIPVSHVLDNLIVYEDPAKYAAQAAIDIFEAEKSTLGLGAGAGKKAMKKISCFNARLYEDWFLKFKGTAFEEKAYSLLSQFVDISYEIQKSYEDPYRDRINELCYELDKLDLERIRMSDSSEITIIIKASELKKACFVSPDSIEDYLSKFEGTDLEFEAVNKVKELLNLVQEQTANDSRTNHLYELESDIMNEMDQLSYELLRMDMVETPSISGFPEMEQDLLGLMGDMGPEDIYDEVMGSPESFMPKDFSDEDLSPSLYAKKSYKMDTPLKVEERDFNELGKFRDGIDTAEVDPGKFPFEVGDTVKLKEKLEIAQWYDIPKVIEKGSKGTIYRDWDGSGNYYMVTFEDGCTHKVLAEKLSK